MNLSADRLWFPLLTVLLSAGSAFGALAVTPSGTLTDDYTPYDLTMAWDFSLTQSYQVTALDFYTNGSPYSRSHQVGIWAAGVDTGYPIGTLLATVTFSAGTPGTLNGAYRSLPISPIVLNPGTYEVGVFIQGGADPYLFSQTSYTLLPGIVYNGSGHVDTSGSFTYPGGSNIGAGHFAANFEAQLPPPAPSQVVSRKLHNGVPYDIVLPLTGSSGIECRSGGATNDYQVVFTFPGSVTFSSASVTAGAGTVSSSSGSGTTTVTVNLTGVTNAQRITVTLSSVNNGTSTGDVSVPMGVLLGDTNGNGNVSATDVSQVKAAASTGTVTAGNFRTDLNASGSVTATDVAIVKAQSGQMLPP